MQSERETRSTVAAWWLDRGYVLLPVQPGTKCLVKGYGPTLQRISDPDHARRWFQDTQVNIAALAISGYHLTLDFDDVGVYKSWSRANPEAAKSYTEQTPRGGRHVFLTGGGWFDNGGPVVKTVKGLEIKPSVLVAPSYTSQGVYIRGDGEILHFENLLPALEGFTSGPTVFSAERIQRAIPVDGRGLVVKIKKFYTLVEMAQTLGIVLVDFHPGKRWVHARCPFHDDRRPSMWLDVERGVWGCMACNISGDVINLYAL
jgi:hypothetical protein